MGARRHGQEGTLPIWKCCKVFCALVVTAKCSVDELFMHYFHNLSSSSGGFVTLCKTAPYRNSLTYLLTYLPGLHPWDSAGDFRPVVLSSPNA